MIPDPYHRLKPDHLSTNAQRVLGSLRAANRPCTRRRVGADVPIAYIDILKALDELAAAGVVSTEGNGPAARYSLTEVPCRKSA